MKIFLILAAAMLAGSGCTTNINAYQSQIEVQCASDFAKGDPAVSVGGLTTPGLTIDKRSSEATPE